MILILLILILIFLFYINRKIGLIYSLLKEKEKVINRYKNIFVYEGDPSKNSTDKDPLFNKAKQILKGSRYVSASLLQRRLAIGYARAARILDQLEAKKYVGIAKGDKPREVLINKSQTA